MFLQIVVPHLDALTGESEIRHGTLYSFLPTQVSLSVPLACHVPFKLDGSREFIDPQDNNSWFLHSCKTFAAMLQQVIVDLAHKYKSEIIRYIPRKNDYIFEFSNEKIKCLRREEFKGSTYLNLPIFYTVNENFRSINEIFCFSPNEDIPNPVEAYRLLGESRELFLPSKQNLGITIEKDIAKKLFERAMRNPSTTESVLKYLSAIKSFPYEENLESFDDLLLNLEQVITISKFSKCINAFTKLAVAKLQIKRRPQFRLRMEGQSTSDVRNTMSDVLLNAADFEENAAKYFELINYRCIKSEKLSENSFFIAHNVLVLPVNQSIDALSEFCRRVDKNGTFAAALKLNAASNTLNNALNLPPQEYLRRLRAARKSIKFAFGDKVYKNYINMINQSGSSPDRYINELLQNADDCTYPSGVIPSFEFVISELNNRAVATRYNEVGFSNENVRAITAIGESTKKKLLNAEQNLNKIGEKGVGFKSVFSVAKKVEIFSGEFSFSLTADEPTIPNLVENPFGKQSGTTMRFSLKEPLKNNFFTEETVLRLCRCLRTLRRIKLGEFHIEIEDTATTRKIIINDKCYEYQVFAYSFDVSDSLLAQERKLRQRQIASQQKIVLYIPKTKEKNGYLYSGLPTDIKTNIPLYVDAPLNLTTSRDGVLDCEWNDLIKEEIYNAIIDLAKELKTSQADVALTFLNFKNTGGTTSPNIFEDNYLNKINLISKIEKVPLLPTYVNGVFATHKQTLYRVPKIIHFLLKKGEDIGIERNKILKTREGQFDILFTVLRIRLADFEFVLPIVCDHYEKYMADDSFRKLFYSYLLENSSKLNPFKLQSMKIVPILGRFPKQTEYVNWTTKIYTKEGATTSPKSYYILNTDVLSKSDCEKILNVHINEMNIREEIALYREQIQNKINSTFSDEELYHYLLGEFRSNHGNILSIGDTLSRFYTQDKIPLRTENGRIRKGKVFLSDYDSGYYTGSVLPNHISHKECYDFAKLIGCKRIIDVYFDDLDFVSQLSADDIECFQDNDDFKHSYEILERCIRENLIPLELVQYYNLGGFIKRTINYDKNTVFNDPIKNLQQFNSYMEKELSNPIKIIKKEVPRIVNYGRSRNGTEFCLDNADGRLEAIERYSPEHGYCVCQMCKEAMPNSRIEVNKIEKNPSYYWKQCQISLCLNCSKHFEELRQNDKILYRFIREIESADPSSSYPISIPIGDESITFSQMHIAEIQKILRWYAEKLKK